MADYRTMFDYLHLRAWDLDGQDVTLTIERVEAGVIENADGESKRMPFVYFKGMGKPLGLNKTNGKSLAGMYGTDVRKWIGKRVTLYPTTTQYGGETKECIRIRPGVPADEDEPTDLLRRAPDEPTRKKVA
jgi:hypothetical protein